MFLCLERCWIVKRSLKALPLQKVTFPSVNISGFTPTGGECVWRRGGRRSPGRVDGPVWGGCVAARGGGPIPPQGHWRAAVSDGGAVRTADPRPEGGSRHVKPQPAQPVEGHGRDLYEAQRRPSGRPGLQSLAHRVLTLTCLLCFCHFSFFSPVFLPLSQITPAPAAASPSSFFSLSDFFIILWGDCAKSVMFQGTMTSSSQPLSRSLCCSKHYLNPQRSSSI